MVTSGPAVVTGAAGFLGQALVRALLAEGWPVIGIDRLPQPPARGLRAVTVDLLDGEPAVAHALRSAAAVFHLAGCPGVRDTGPDVALRRRRDNPLAAAAVLEAVPATTPVVVTSSSSVYGGTRPDRAARRPCTETDPLRPRGGYARSKVEVEQICAAHLRAGKRVAVARPFTAAGEGQRADMALAQWIAAARAGRPLRILGSPDRTRDITDVRDVARALIALADGGVRGPVNLGTGVGHSLATMIDTVADVLGVPVTSVVEPAGPEEVPDTLADTARLRRVVGFVPVTDLRDVVARQVAQEERGARQATRRGDDLAAALPLGLRRHAERRTKDQAAPDRGPDGDPHGDADTELDTELDTKPDLEVIT